MPTASRSCKDHYAVLNLRPLPSLQNSLVPVAITAKEIKQAYRKALLEHHPDKRQSCNERSEEQTPSQVAIASSITIDDITEAFEVLSREDTRREYDRSLALSRRQKRSLHTRKTNGTNDSPNFGDSASASSSEVEDIAEGIIYKQLDLDELKEEEASTGEQVWSTDCRCGMERGYIVTEKELEKESRKGLAEVWVQCGGCSLWLGVEFGTEE